MGRLFRPPLVFVLAATIGLVGLVGGFGLVLFEPWRLFTNTTVDEAAPVVPATQAPGGDGADATGQASQGTTKVLARGTLITHEHDTTGTVVVYELADGKRVLRFENLDTSDGPDLRVWITDASVIEGEAGWRVFDDGKHVELGELKGNKGNQNYDVPADADLTELTSVSIWCIRFHVSFGAAELKPA